MDQDFLEYDTFCMSSITLMMANIILIVAASAYVFEKIFQRFALAFSIQIGLDVLNILLFIWMIWSGTSIKKLYRKRNLAIMAVMALAQASITVYSIVANKIMQPYGS